MSGFNLPPGCGVHDIPGNEPPRRGLATLPHRPKMPTREQVDEEIRRKMPGLTQRIRPKVKAGTVEITEP